MKKKPTLVTVPASAATQGIFLVSLDISWFKSPLIARNRLIETQKELDKLRASGATTITIDTSKGLDPRKSILTAATKSNLASAHAPATPNDASNPSPSENKKRPATRHEDMRTSRHTPVSLNAEMGEAKRIQSELTHAVNKLHDDIAHNKVINTKVLTPFINQTVDSLTRNNQALMSLAHIGQRSKKIADHCFSVYCLALNIARLNQASDTDIQHLGLAALLHESGWISIPINLMGKRTRYTASEEKLLSRHPLLGVKALAAADLHEDVLRIIQEHHECIDGSGYPAGLKAEALHPLSKMLTVADIYDESVHQLTDQPGMLPSNAIKHIYNLSAQGKLDKHSVKLIISLLGIYPVSSAVQLSNGAKGIVREMNGQYPVLPTVELFYDKNGKAKSQSTLFDMSRQGDESAIKISSILDPKSHKDDPKKLLLFDL